MTTTNSSYSCSISSPEEEIKIKGSGPMTTVDQIVKIELEAAEVLAGLAMMQSSSSIRYRDGGGVDESGCKWGLKGKRARKRVKSELPAAAAADPDRKSKFSTALSSETCQDITVPEKQHSDDVCRNIKFKSVKAEQAELSRTGPLCNKSDGLLCRSRCRQNSTEAEKEERRIRRILANRESARQTIRRRQADCDELTKRAADLSVENANLKREKELFEKEYTSLRNMNDYLKEQMAMQIKSDEVETSKESTSTHVEVAAPQSTNSPLLLCSTPHSTPFVWPFVIQLSNHIQLSKDPEKSIVSPKVPTSLTLQSSNSVQSVNEIQNGISISPDVITSSITQSSNFVQSQNEPNNPIILSSSAPLTIFSNHNSSHAVEKSSTINGSKTPICLLPCHWLFPLPDHRIEYFRHHLDESTANYTANGSSSSQTLACVENQNPSFHAQLNSGSRGNEETRTAYNLNDTPFRFPPDGQIEADSKITVINPTPLSLVIPGSTKRENRNSQGSLNKEATSSVSSYTVGPLPTKNGSCISYTSKSHDEVVGAAEARKKRKELTRLKNLRPFRINC